MFIDMFSRFDTTPACDERTNGQTDGDAHFATAYPRYA